MHYYEQNIGDYRKDTGHLTLLEHGIYRALLDTYYLDEKPLTLEHAKLMRSHCVRTADEVQAFENVLLDFFERTESGYTHKRCEEVIAAYREKGKKAKASADARWAREREQAAYEAAKNSCDPDSDDMRTHSDGNANHKPVTNNHKPKESTPPQAAPAAPKKSRKSPKTSLPAGFEISEGVRQWAAKNGHADLEKHFASFVIKVRAKGYEYADWDSALQNAISDDWAKLRQQSGASGVPGLCWWANDELIKAKGNTLGMSPRPGELMAEFKARIQQKLDGVQPPSPSRAPPVVQPPKASASPDELQKMKSIVGYRGAA